MSVPRAFSVALLSGYGQTFAGLYTDAVANFNYFPPLRYKSLSIPLPIYHIAS